MDFLGSSAENVVTLSDSLQNAVIQGATVQVGGVFDVRQYSSYYLSVSANASSTAATQPVICRTLVEFDLNPSGSTFLYEDSWEHFAYQIAPATFQYSSDVLMIQDNIRGPYMQVFFVNSTPAGANINMDVAWTLYASTRQLPGQSVREDDTSGIPDGVLLHNSQNIAAGATATYLCKYAFGRGWLTWFTGGQIFTIRGFAGSNSGFPLFSYSAPANNRDQRELVIPKRCMSITAQNTGAATAQLDMSVVAQYPIDM